jgi:hypothetical protein
MMLGAWLAKARKAIAATVSAAVVLLIAANSDGNISPEEWGAIASSVVIGAITYYIRNRGLPGGSVPPNPNAVGRPPL